MRYSFIGLLTFLFLVGCSSDSLENYTVGDDFIDTTVRIRKIDTFTVNTGTYKLDSLATSGTNRILLGSIEDDELGKIASKSFFQVQPSSFTINEEAVYDSIGFVLSYGNYYYGDTTRVQKYNIYKIDEEFETKNDENDNFYNTSSLELEKDVDGNSILYGELEFTPTASKDTIYIPMNHNLGEEIFDNILNEDIATTAEFIDVYKGFSIAPDESSEFDNTSVVGFNYSVTSGIANNSAMRLYYTLQEDLNEESVSNYLEFNISSSGDQFNQILGDDTNTIIEKFIDEETTVSSDELNDLFFAQAGTGIVTKIDIPHLRKLKELGLLGTSLSAELILFPKKGSYDDDRPLPTFLNAYVIDHKNRVISNLFTEVGGVVSAILQEDGDGVEDNIFYSINMDGFVEQIIGATEQLEYSIALEVPESSNSVDRVVFEKNDDVKLTVTYLTY